jgi:hypothetical protein
MTSLPDVLAGSTELLVRSQGEILLIIKIIFLTFSMARGPLTRLK